MELVGAGSARHMPGCGLVPFLGCEVIVLSRAKQIRPIVQNNFVRLCKIVRVLGLFLEILFSIYFGILRALS